MIAQKFFVFYLSAPEQKSGCMSQLSGMTAQFFGTPGSLAFCGAAGNFLKFFAHVRKYNAGLFDTPLCFLCLQTDQKFFEIFLNSGKMMGDFSESRPGRFGSIVDNFPAVVARRFPAVFGFRSGLVCFPAFGIC